MDLEREREVDDRKKEEVRENLGEEVREDRTEWWEEQHECTGKAGRRDCGH